MNAMFTSAWPNTVLNFISAHWQICCAQKEVQLSAAAILNQRRESLESQVDVAL